MRLRYSPTSPYVRKVMMLAIERGLADAIEKIPTDFSVLDPAFVAENPLRKVPTLVLDDGTVLFDSPVVCEYLDHLPGGRHLLPPVGPERWVALRRQALADGIADAAVMVRLERVRVEHEQSLGWIERQITVIQRGVVALEREVQTFPSEPDIGTLAVIAALGFIDLRLPDIGWRSHAPALAAWAAAQADRPSVRETAPPKI